MKLHPADRRLTPPLVAACQPPSLLMLGVVLSLVGLGGCSPPALFENEYGSVVAAIDSDAVIPSGMRRTKNGWEDASLWHVSTDLQSRSIESWMKGQREREPSWVRAIFEQIRRTPPLMIAVIQITAIAAIVHISQAHQAEQARSSAKKPSERLP